LRKNDLHYKPRRSMMKKAGVAEGEEKQRLSEGRLKRWENSGADQNRYCRK
jgi:hypothetical protein